MNQLKSVYNIPFLYSYSHPIHTCLSMIASNVFHLSQKIIIDLKRVKQCSLIVAHQNVPITFIHTEIFGARFLLIGSKEII